LPRRRVRVEFHEKKNLKLSVILLPELNRDVILVRDFLYLPDMSLNIRKGVWYFGYDPTVTFFFDSNEEQVLVEIQRHTDMDVKISSRNAKRRQRRSEEKMRQQSISTQSQPQQPPFPKKKSPFALAMAQNEVAPVTGSYVQNRGIPVRPIPMRYSWMSTDRGTIAQFEQQNGFEHLLQDQPPNAVSLIPSHPFCPYPKVLIITGSESLIVDHLNAWAATIGAHLTVSPKTRLTDIAYLG
jgi:hypothetical protein